ncbi:phosphatidylinositol mannoside acyltransferase [Kribbella solani]|uniref:KDO2-lipid IV(A) lauroyltransferase n=1 Tax=Kribbella solani TaxID=236067 RepID=A0A841DHC0_9ACTN|nr:phosphatidylinositol mannoside acyltransferase [Kribbella solani]MBB5978544.1 KDO2-lipid IV(A) lauroyltransferase [Kribbella solani]MDX2968459.1 phosphatidylinositol mannoside acyltransferase [Kribbella solani]MDX3005017.1 phosphatidylinositol mannoside acyltransferase [Kribbella solani]
MDGLRHRAVDLAFALAWTLVRRLPESTVSWLFRQAADRTYRRNGRGVRRLRGNLAIVCPDATDAELDDLTRAGMRSYLRYWQEAFRLPEWTDAEVVGRVRTVNEKLLRDAHAAGRGVICALPHLANYDHAGAWAGLTGMPVSTVAERLQPESLFDRFIEYRKRLGMEVLPLTGSDQDVTGVLADRLRAGGFVCLVADRDLSERGVPVTFFGQPSRMPVGPAALSLKTGAPLIPATLHYDGPELVITFHDTIEPDTAAEMTQRCADAFAIGIAAHPRDWHMLQRIFLN